MYPIPYVPHVTGTVVQLFKTVCPCPLKRFQMIYFFSIVSDIKGPCFHEAIPFFRPKHYSLVRFNICKVHFTELDDDVFFPRSCVSIAFSFRYSKHPIGGLLIDSVVAEAFNFAFFGLIKLLLINYVEIFTHNYYKIQSCNCGLLRAVKPLSKVVYNIRIFPHIGIFSRVFVRKS